MPWKLLTRKQTVTNGKVEITLKKSLLPETHFPLKFLHTRKEDVNTSKLQPYVY